MQYADGKHDIEARRREWQGTDIGLRNPPVGATAEIALRRLYRVAEVDRDDVRAPPAGNIGIPTRADARVEHQLSGQKIRREASLADELPLRRFIVAVD